MKRRLTQVIFLLALAVFLKQTAFSGSSWRPLARTGIALGGSAGTSPRTIGVREGASVMDVRLLDYSWEGWRPATCMPDRCFCERIHDGAIRQPVNTWSNLAFILVGLLVINTAIRDLSQAWRSESSNPMQTQLIYPGVYGVTTILIGIGSMLYHSSLAFVGQAVDVISMYLLTSFMGLYNLSRMRRMSNGAFLACYLLVNVTLAFVSVEWPVLRRYIFLMLVLAVLVSEGVVRRKRQPRMNVAFLNAALISLVGAFAIWTLDITQVICAPDSWFQGHALWHVLMATLIGFIYLYYRSEGASVGLTERA
jgi:hypothetical protein